MSSEAGRNPPNFAVRHSKDNLAVSTGRPRRDAAQQRQMLLSSLRKQGGIRWLCLSGGNQNQSIPHKFPPAPRYLWERRSLVRAPPLSHSLLRSGIVRIFGGQHEAPPQGRHSAETDLVVIAPQERRNRTNTPTAHDQRWSRGLFRCALFPVVVAEGADVVVVVPPLLLWRREVQERDPSATTQPAGRRIPQS